MQIRMVSWVVLLVAAGTAVADEPGQTALELRPIRGDTLAERRVPVPRDACEVFLYLGEPREIRVTDDRIAVDYGRAGVLFDRATGKAVQRLTVADGYDRLHPAPFAPQKPKALGDHRVAPGIVEPWHHPKEGEPRPMVPAAEVEYRGRNWRALQPAGTFSRMGYRGDWSDLRGGWSAILPRLNGECYLEADAKRYTMAEGLPSNIVTHLAVHGDTLWAACVDIYDPEKKAWGPGGLARYDAGADRWVRVDKIDGRSVRWVTVLEAIGDDLWIAFREGDGVAGDSVLFGMFTRSGVYRPRTTAVVVGRLAGGKWSTFARPPLPAISDREREEEKGAFSTETPFRLALRATQAFLYSNVKTDYWGDLEGRVSMLDTGTGAWTTFDMAADFDARFLKGITSGPGEVVVASDRGAHRWDAVKGAWLFLDPQPELKNPTFGGVAVRGNELWVGYTEQDWGVPGWLGISIFDEKRRTWTHQPLKVIGARDPVFNFVVLPSGDVWAPFNPPLYDAPSGPPGYDPRDHGLDKSMLGRFVNGRWEVPARLRSAPGSPGFHLTGVRDLLAIGDIVLAATKNAVYAGPPWGRVLSAHIHTVHISDDGKALLVYGGPDDGEKVRRLRYDPATRRVTREVVSRNTPGRQQPQDFFSIKDSGRPASSTEMRYLRVGKSVDWALGPFVSWYDLRYTTSESYWLIRRGCVIRLDRRRLAAVLED